MNIRLLEIATRILTFTLGAIIFALAIFDETHRVTLIVISLILMGVISAEQLLALVDRRRDGNDGSASE